MTARIAPDSYTRRFCMSDGDVITGIGDGDMIARERRADEYGTIPKGDVWARTRAHGYRSQAARDAANRGYGSQSYVDYIERQALESHAYFTKRGDTERAEEMLTRSLGAALAGNDGI